MQRNAVQAAVLTAVIGISAGDAVAADYRLNPLTLTYAGAINRNEPGAVNIHPGIALTATLKRNGRSMSGHSTQSLWILL